MSPARGWRRFRCKRTPWTALKTSQDLIFHHRHMEMRKRPRQTGTILCRIQDSRFHCSKFRPSTQ
uniref:Uncharacterized protein n=1 Tax=Anguilla anguilla TaxID=7936 RepID=A0A0E9XAB1_ANGAN